MWLGRDKIIQATTYIEHATIIVRAASRYWFDPRARNEGVGFRVVVAPRLA
jgi:hypothetical protein